jgi:hypothetical protein
MCGKERVYRHLPERVKRQFFFVQDIPRHPSDVAQVPTQLLTTVLGSTLIGEMGVRNHGIMTLAT